MPKCSEFHDDISPDHFGQAWAVDKIAEVGNPGKGRKGIHSIPEHFSLQIRTVWRFFVAMDLGSPFWQQPGSFFCDLRPSRAGAPFLLFFGMFQADARASRLRQMQVSAVNWVPCDI